MRGHIRRRSENSWAIVLTLGRTIDPKTGKSKPNQKWVTVKGTKKDAERKCAELIHKYNIGEYQEPTDMTVGEWLSRWLEVYVKKSSKKKMRTKETYKSVVENHLIPSLGHFRLQKLQPSDVQNYYNTSSLSPSTLEQHHGILHQAFKVAVQQERLLNVNVVGMVAEKPTASKDLEINTWDEDEVRRFFKAAKEEGIQWEAFYRTAIETGMRKGELCGLKWDDIDFDTDTISVCRTLVKAGPEPMTDSPKSGRGRAIVISKELSRLLRRYKAAQNELRMKLGSQYRDYGFVFTRATGAPVNHKNINERNFDKIIKAAGVKRIRFHDLRHTCATLLLASGTHPKVVQERLGHANISMTMDRYSHVTPTMQADAARLLGDVLEKVD
jgi:integrase